MDVNSVFTNFTFHFAARKSFYTSDWFVVLLVGREVQFVVWEGWLCHSLG